MDSNELGEPLFLRTYHCGDDREILIRIWDPNPPQCPMFCWFQIGDGSIHRAPGMDPLGALLNAVMTIEMLLARKRYQEDPKLHWKGALEDGDLGLPRFYPDHEWGEDKKNPTS